MPRFWCEACYEAAECVPECVDGPECPGTQQRFELGEGLFGRVQVGAVGRCFVTNEARLAPRSLETILRNAIGSGLL